MSLEMGWIIVAVVLAIVCAIQCVCIKTLNSRLQDTTTKYYELAEALKT